MPVLGKVYKKYVGTTPYWVVTYVGPVHYIIKKVIENVNVAEEYTIDETYDEAPLIASHATDFEEVQALDMTHLV